MNFEESFAPRTRFDINFRLGDIHVRVHPYFWLTTLLLGMDFRNPGPDAWQRLLIWAVDLFVSILVHELGHVLMGRWLGSRGHILLTGFCGLAIGASELPTRRQRIAVYLAGPGAGFLLAGVLVGIYWLYNPDVTLFLLGSLVQVIVPIGFDAEIPPPLIFYAMYISLWVNLFWGLVNLLPIWPLDGGQVCREVATHYRGQHGVRVSLKVSIGTAAAMGALALIEMINKKPLVAYVSFGGSLFPVLFFGLLAFASWQILQQIGRSGGDDYYEQERRDPWERDPDWWKRGGDRD